MPKKKKKKKVLLRFQWLVRIGKVASRQRVVSATRSSVNRIHAVATIITSIIIIIIKTVVTRRVYLVVVSSEGTVGIRRIQETTGGTYIYILGMRKKTK